MKTNGYVYLRINKNYVATVIDLDSLSYYLDNVSDIDDTFGKVECISNVSDRFLKRMHYIISLAKERRNKSMVGKCVEVFRNQAIRYGIVVGASSNSFLIEYVMPNGTSSLNVVKNLNRPDNYKAITYKRAFNSYEFGDQLNGIKHKLINNPQRG